MSWGRIRIVDRLGVDNRFLTFGGVLRSAAVDDDLTVVSIASPGPLARWSGHSQGSDPLASEIGAFFGRLLVRVDFEPGVEARLAETPPIELYAAFVRNAHDRLAAAAQLRQVEPAFAIWVAAGGGPARAVGSRRLARRRAASSPSSTSGARPGQVRVHPGPTRNRKTPARRRGPRVSVGSAPTARDWPGR